MIPYILLAFAPPTISYFFCSRKQDRKARIVFSIALFFTGFLLLVACRDLSIGVDNKTYIFMFESFSKLEWEEILQKVEIEHGYAFLNKICFLIKQDYQFLVFSIALISILPIAIMYIKESESSLLTIALFLTTGIFSMYFSGLRQVIAMAFIVPAYYFTKNKRPICFIITVLLATLFHQSAFVMLIFYPVYRSKITAKKFLYIIPAVLIGYIFNAQIFTLLLKFIGERYEDRYGVIESTGAITMIILFVLFVAYSYFIVDENKFSSDDFGLRNVLIICLVLQLFAPVNSVAMRMNYYFIPFIPLTIPKMANRCKNNYKQLAWFSVAVMSAFFMMYFIFDGYTGTDTLQIFPYKFFWQ